MIATSTLSTVKQAPRQCKLLGAQVRGLGLVVAVSSTLPFCYAVIEGSDKVNRLVRLSELKREDVTLPVQPQPYTTGTERVAYNTWDEVHSLVQTQALELQVAA